MMPASTMKRALVFDVNETLLDVGALDRLFVQMFGDASIRREWFGQVLQSAFVSTITHTYRDFGTLAMAALTMVADRHGVSPSKEDRSALSDGMRQLPPHPEVKAALERLRDAGFRLATLTNSTTEVAELQVTNAGLRDLFEMTLSADSVRRLKPSPEPYRMAAEYLGVPVDRMRLVAAHAWDITGALNAGCAAAFVARPGQVLDPSSTQPDIVGADLLEVADRIITVDQ